MKITAQVKIKTQIIDATTGKIVKEQPFKSNLVLDNALNALAQKSGITGCPVCNPASCFKNIILGSSNSPTSIASGAVTFTQAAAIVTASAGFFTSGMVGALFKYGTGAGGAEYYITGFTSSTVVTVDTSATVATPTVGTVWFVNQTALVTPLTLAATSYQTNSGDNSTTFASNQVTFKRTFIVAQQVSPYSVNEIGWNSSPISTTTNGVNGRIVLGSTDVVGTSNFYLVVLNVIFTYAPGTPTAVANVGTNINTAGTAMMESWSISVVTAAGGVTGAVTTGAACLDQSGFGAAPALFFFLAAYTQLSTISTTNGANGTMLTVASTGSWANVAGQTGIMQLSFTSSITTSGQLLYGISIWDNGNQRSAFDILFTTPQTAPTGTFQPNTIFQIQYARALVN